MMYFVPITLVFERYIYDPWNFRDFLFYLVCETCAKNICLQRRLGSRYRLRTRSLTLARRLSSAVMHLACRTSVTSGSSMPRLSTTRGWHLLIATVTRFRLPATSSPSPRSSLRTPACTSARRATRTARSSVPLNFGFLVNRVQLRLLNINTHTHTLVHHLFKGKSRTLL